jgi:hypothetical protein
MFHISWVAYHGSDFNGVSCRRIAVSAEVNSKGIIGILLHKNEDKL